MSIAYLFLLRVPATRIFLARWTPPNSKAFGSTLVLGCGQTGPSHDLNRARRVELCNLCFGFFHFLRHLSSRFPLIPPLINPTPRFVIASPTFHHSRSYFHDHNPPFYPHPPARPRSAELHTVPNGLFTHASCWYLCSLHFHWHFPFSSLVSCLSDWRSDFVSDRISVVY